MCQCVSPTFSWSEYDDSEGIDVSEHSKQSDIPTEPSQCPGFSHTEGESDMRFDSESLPGQSPTSKHFKSPGIRLCNDSTSSFSMIFEPKTPDRSFFGINWTPSSFGSFYSNGLDLVIDSTQASSLDLSLLSLDRFGAVMRKRTPSLDSMPLVHSTSISNAIHVGVDLITAVTIPPNPFGNPLPRSRAFLSRKREWMCKALPLCAPATWDIELAETPTRPAYDPARDKTPPRGRILAITAFNGRQLREATE